jgi:hypothetical protein
LKNSDLQIRGLERDSKTMTAVILTVVLVSGLAIAAYMYSLDKYSLLYYGDAVSHLIAGRKLFDWSENPGWNQIGTVWLPLPHFLLMFPSMIDALFFSGFAGLAISLPSLAITTLLLYKMVLRFLKKLNGGNSDGRKITFLAAAVALLFGLNPNFLYLGMTAMTETLFMLFFVGSAYYLFRWFDYDPDDSGQTKGKTRYLLLASVFASAATLCRYEGWVLPLLILSSAILIHIIRVRRASSTIELDVSESGSSHDSNNLQFRQGKPEKDHARKSKYLDLAKIALVSSLSFSGIVFWLAYNAVTYGDPLEFANAQYYSAASQAADRTFRGLLFLQPLNVINIYGTTALIVFGPVVLASSGIGLFAYLLTRRESKRAGENNNNHRRFVSVLLYLAAPAAFTLLTLFAGIGEMSFWFNSRFIILLAPVLMILVGISLFKAPKKFRSRTLPLAGALVALFAFQSAMPAFGAIVTLIDAKSGFDYAQSPHTVIVGEKIAELYDGTGSIMMITGSQQEHRIMIASGIQLANFDSIIESSTWKPSFQEPWLYDKWILMAKEPDSDGVKPVSYWEERQETIDRYYQRVFEDDYYRIFQSKA